MGHLWLVVRWGEDKAMKINAYLVIGRNNSLRVVKTRPYLNNTEIALTLKLDIPDVFFDRLMPTVQINVPDDAIVNVSPDVAVNIAAQEISQALSLDYIETRDGLKEMILKEKTKREVGNLK